MEKLKTVWEWIKDHVFAVCLAVAAALLFVFGRRTDGDRGDSIEDFIDRSEEYSAAAEGKNSELGGKLEECEDLADGITDDNQIAESRIDEALGILDRAEKRPQEGKVE